MSVFRVNLHSFNDGPADSKAFGTAANQQLVRSTYVMGPKRINRLVKDGETFTDCNYWKRFAYPALPLNQAWIDIVSDDGSEWVDQEGFVPSYAKVYSLDIDSSQDIDTNDKATILTDTGSVTNFCQITNLSSAAVKIKLNGSANAILTLPATSSQVFNANDLAVSLVEVDTTGISVTGTKKVEVICSVLSESKS